jgi:hypothetical protein
VTITNEIPIFFAVFKITVTQEECNIKYILQMRKTKMGHPSKAGRMYDVTFRRVRETIVALEKQ